MNNNLVAQITKSQIRTDLPKFVTGDTIKVNVRIIECGKNILNFFLVLYQHSNLIIA